ncbi:M48 family metalloprotease [Halapricum sp. CBA1109]|uniref:M48 family metalloprotease n=1 Tax=Halapricum sp. CBA1109 TaxID=2668068 RepID=UPI0012F7A1F5|nr:M48 family metalloprotease [Halapricum sp. CBA1109]MUV89400.1 M48 family metalloprotease [Halapricum sp. CBA1109]
MEWSHDRELDSRMVLALALSGVGYIALFGPLTMVMPLSLVIAIAVVVAIAVAVLVHEADRLLYPLTGAYAIERADYPKLFDTVDRLAQQAGMPRPPVAVVPHDQPNALSAGRGDRTVVCVTTGLLKTLEDDELEAVLAHELAHCKNGDSAVLTAAAFPTTLALWTLSESIDQANGVALFFGYLPALVVLAVLSAVLLVVSLPGTLVLARYREYAADRGAVAITGDPVALAEALATIHGTPRKPQTDLRGVSGLNAFCIVPSGTGLFTIPWTHPPVAARIRALRELQAELS